MARLEIVQPESFVRLFLITQQRKTMELSELRTKEDVADYLRYLIHALETGEKTPEKVSVGVAAVKALAVELDRPRGLGNGWVFCPSPALKAAEEMKPASRSRSKRKP